jgi:selenide,water dikinase
MTRPSGVDAEIQLDMLPLLDGAITCVHAGIVSSLQSANRRLASVVRDDQAYVGHPSYPLLFDPQTAGGLLASVPYNNAPACIAALHSLGYSAATAIGRAKPPTGALASISLVTAQRSKPTPITPPTSL